VKVGKGKRINRETAIGRTGEGATGAKKGEAPELPPMFGELAEMAWQLKGRGSAVSAVNARQVRG
jgi:hypothetical protein